MPRLVFFFFSVQWKLMNCSWFCGKPRQKYWAGVSKCIKIYQAQPNLLRISVIKSMIRVPSIALYYFIFFSQVWASKLSISIYMKIWEAVLWYRVDKRNAKMLLFPCKQFRYTSHVSWNDYDHNDSKTSSINFSLVIMSDYTC